VKKYKNEKNPGQPHSLRIEEVLRVISTHTYLFLKAHFQCKLVNREQYKKKKKPSWKVLLK
jgi:hypothetical protein